MKRHLTKISILAFGALAACGAGSPVPHDTMAASEGSIRAAEEVGASDVPTAALHLQFAREQTETAERLMKKGDNERARYVLLRAQADAELAVTLSREDAARIEAEKAMEQVQALQTGKPVVQ